MKGCARRCQLSRRGRTNEFAGLSFNSGLCSEGPMRRSLLAGALLIGTSSILSAAEVRIDEHTLCPVALHAFDEKDLPAIEEFSRFVQGVFDDLNARYSDREEPAPRAKLTDKSVEVPVILGFCRQHPRSTIYQEAVNTYRGMRSLRTPLGGGDTEAPMQKQKANEGASRFRE